MSENRILYFEDEVDAAIAKNTRFINDHYKKYFPGEAVFVVPDSEDSVILAARMCSKFTFPVVWCLNDDWRFNSQKPTLIIGVCSNNSQLENDFEDLAVEKFLLILREKDIKTEQIEPTWVGFINNFDDVFEGCGLSSKTGTNRNLPYINIESENIEE